MFRKFPIIYLADILNVTEREFHREIKPLIIADYKKELQSNGIQNPDIGLDKDSNIYLVDPNNPSNYVETRINIFDYL